MKRATRDMDGVQRVRIGLTGLAFVFLLVLLAAIFTRASNETPITPNNVDPDLSEGASAGQPLAPPPEAAAPKEPLAELGVAPGNAETNKAAPANAPEGAAGQ
jgi:hypothetical protein